MNILYKKLYTLYLYELKKLSIGYEFNIKSLDEMVDIIHAINYIHNENINTKEIFKIINYYE